MPFADGAETENEANGAFSHARLIRVRHDARVEQGRGFERIFVEKISPDQAALRLAQWSMWIERLLHLRGARFKNLEQIPMAAREVFEHLVQLLRGSFGIEPKHAVNDVIGTDLVSRVEVARLSRRFEGPDDDSGRVWAQIEALAIHEFGLGQRCSLGAIELDLCRCRWMMILTRVLPGVQQPWP